MSSKPGALSGPMRTLATTKPKCRTLEQLNEIADFLLQQSFFSGLDRDTLLAVAFFVESKHAEAGECVLSKGQPLETLCLMLEGSAALTSYSAKPQHAAPAGGLLLVQPPPAPPAPPAALTRPASARLGSVGSSAAAGGGAEVVTTIALQAPEGSWGEVALLHSSQPRRSTRTVVAGPTGCVTLQLRHTDYDALTDPRTAMMLLPPEGQVGPPAVVELSMTQRRAAAHALLCCAVRRVASVRPPAARTPEDVAELSPLLGCLPPYRAYPPELLAAMAAAGSFMRLPAGSMVYESGTLADSQVTVLSGEVELRRFGAGGGEADGGEADGGGPGAPSTTSQLLGPGAPTPPPAEDESNNIRARLKKERDARKALQARLDDYMGRMQGEVGDNTGETAAGKAAAVAAAAKAAAASNHVDWTRIFMQKAMVSAEPLWKALHPDDTTAQQGAGGGTGGRSRPSENGDGEEEDMAGLLGPAVAKAYFRGLRGQGYTDNEGMGAAGGVGRGSESGGPGAAGGSASARGSGDGSVRTVRAARWGFSVDGPESESEKKLRHMAMHASRMQRSRASRSTPGSYYASEMEEAYGGLCGTVGRGGCAGELSTHTLHSAMRHENAVAGPSGCEVMLVDWDAYQQGVLNARAGALTRSAAFLAELPPGRLLQLAELCLVLRVAPGTLLAKQAGPLESMVVVQSGELLLLHELPATNRTPKPHTLTASAVSRTRAGRIHTLPLLSTLNQTVLPTAAAAKDATAAALGGPAPPPGASPAPPMPLPALASPAGSAPSSAGGNTTGGNMIDVTLHGLPLGELGVNSIVGENILGVKEKERERERERAGSRTADGSASATGSISGSADGAGASASGGVLDAHAPHPPPGAPSPSPPPHPPGGGAAAAAADGSAPKWPATVLASKPSVLLVIQKSVLYMAEFDFLRGDLQKYAAERQAWVAKRVEAAYRDAAAPGSVPAVFLANAGLTAAQLPVASPAPPPGSGLSSPSLRRSMFAAATNAAIAAAYISSSAPGSGGGGGGGTGSGSGGILGQLEMGPNSDLIRGVTGDIFGPLGGGGGHNIDGGEPGSGLHPGCTASPMRNTSISSQRGSVDGGPPSANILGRTGSLTGAGPSSSGAGAGVFSRSGSGHRNAPASPATSKWDFLDGPGSATADGSVASEQSAGALGRGGGGAGGPGAPSRASSLQRSGNMKTGGVMGGGGGGGAGGGGRGDPANGLTPVQLALQEVGLDPGLATDGGPGGMAPSGGRDGSNATPPRRNAAPVPAPGVLSAMPQVIAANPPMASPRMRTLQSLRISQSGAPGSFGTSSSGGGGPSLSAGHDYESFRIGGGGGAGAGGSGSNSPALGRGGALTPAGRRSFSGHGPAGVAPGLAASLLDNAGTGSSSYNGRPASPAIAVARSAVAGGQGHRTSYSGGGGRPGALVLPGGGGGGGALDSPTLYALRRGDVGSGTGGPAGSQLAHGVPGLGVVDSEQAAAAAAAAAGHGSAPMSPIGTPIAGGFYIRGAPGRTSFSGSASGRCSSSGMTPTGNDSIRASHGSLGESMRRSMAGVGGLAGLMGGSSGGNASMRGSIRAGGLRGSNDNLVAAAAAAVAAEAEEEAVAARSLVPRNQAGTFMVREGTASTPTRPGMRRIAGAF
ncbi:hypothetical protein HYH02_013571 [Chlamydomonas schloesseri]|uniref:Cyclic nucleotide-binding domain-containing protein n=1 Tax=Chlamydomonas schloesseri TaxID=2026947 RepID=A0A835T360_9CHLO|nr:hypothetical protein HYH02_013571 [Chlamydomonas schloesseri]|eukprot:KAG2430731.1 hypothetical protein HYH02_013571 [Chlamydomonas schloesseri]